MQRIKALYFKKIGFSLFPYSFVFTRCKNYTVYRMIVLRKKTDGRTIGRPLFSLRETKKCAILLLCRQVGPTRRLPPQGRTEAEVVKMTNVELFNSLLTVIGIIVSAVSLGITLSHR